MQKFKKGWFDNKKIDSNYALVLEPSPKFYESDDGTEKDKKSAFSFLFPYFKPYKKVLFQVLLGLLIGTIIQLVLPFLLQSIFDYGVNFKNINFIPTVQNSVYLKLQTNISKI